MAPKRYEFDFRGNLKLNLMIDNLSICGEIAFCKMPQDPIDDKSA